VNIQGGLEALNSATISILEKFFVNPFLDRIVALKTAEQTGHRRILSPAVVKMERLHQMKVGLMALLLILENLSTF
jgi:hypothetical protein